MSSRAPVDRQRIELFLEKLRDHFRRPGRVYLVGGTTMVLEGFRRQEILPHFATASLKRDPDEFQKKFATLKRMWLTRHP